MDRVIKYSSDNSLFNIRMICNPVTYTYASILKFLQKVNPLLPKPNTSNSLLDMYNCFKQMDTDFNNYLNNNIDLWKFTFYIPDEVLTQTALQNMKKVFIVYYTLKLYSITFGIQKFSINSLLAYNKKIKVNCDQVCNEFVFIFRTELIEDKFQTEYPEEVLFDLNPEIGITLRLFY